MDRAAAACRPTKKTSLRPMRPLRDAAAVHSAEETPLPRVAIPLLAAAAASAEAEEALAAAIAAVVEAAGASAALANSTVNRPTRNLASEEPTNAMAADEAIGDPTRTSSTTSFKPRLPEAKHPPLPKTRLLLP